MPIKGWKNAHSDIMRHRAQLSAQASGATGAYLQRKKKNGEWGTAQHNPALGSYEAGPNKVLERIQRNNPGSEYRLSPEHHPTDSTGMHQGASAASHSSEAGALAHNGAGGTHDVSDEPRDADGKWTR